MSKCRRGLIAQHQLRHHLAVAPSLSQFSTQKIFHSSAKLNKFARYSRPSHVPCARIRNWSVSKAIRRSVAKSVREKQLSLSNCWVEHFQPPIIITPNIIWIIHRAARSPFATRHHAECRSELYQSFNEPRWIYVRFVCPLTRLILANARNHTRH